MPIAAPAAKNRGVSRLLQVSEAGVTLWPVPSDYFQVIAVGQWREGGVWRGLTGEGCKPERGFTVGAAVV